MSLDYDCILQGCHFYYTVYVQIYSIILQLHEEKYIFCCIIWLNNCFRYMERIIMHWYFQQKLYVSIPCRLLKQIHLFIQIQFNFQVRILLDYFWINLLLHNYVLMSKRSLGTASSLAAYYIYSQRATATRQSKVNIRQNLQRASILGRYTKTAQLQQVRTHYYRTYWQKLLLEVA